MVEIPLNSLHLLCLMKCLAIYIYVMLQHEGRHPPDLELLLGADLPFMEDIADHLMMK